MTTATLIVGCLLGLAFVGMLTVLGVAWHMAYTMMDVLLGHLKNSSGVIALSPLRHGGPWGKLMLIGGISGFVAYSGFHVKRGGISIEDLNKLPKPLKRKLALLQWSGIGLFVAMALTLALDKVITAYHI